MALVEVVRQRTVKVYTCDCGCGAECDSDFPDYDPENEYTSGVGCGWLALPPYPRSTVLQHHDFRQWSPNYREHPGRSWSGVPLYFASNRCLARWAFRKMIESGEHSCPEPPELRIGTGHYGKAA